MKRPAGDRYRYEQYLERAENDPEIDPVAFRMLYHYAKHRQVVSADEMAAILHIGRDRARAAQKKLADLGYIVRHRTYNFESGAKYTTLHFAHIAHMTAAEEVIAEAEAITASAVVIGEPDASPLVNTDDGISGVLSSSSAEGVQLQLLDLNLSPSETDARETRANVAHTSEECKPMLRTRSSGDFEDRSRSGSDFGDGFIGRLARLDDDYEPAVHPKRQRRGYRPDVVVVRTSKPWDKRRDKDLATWNSGDLAAEFGSLCRRKCPELLNSYNFTRLRGALASKIRSGAKPAELKTIMDLFFQDPRNLRSDSFPLWQRYLASLPGYQTSARLELGMPSADAIPATQLSATQTDEDAALLEAAFAKLMIGNH